MPQDRGTYRSIYTTLPDEPQFQDLTKDARGALLIMKISRDSTMAGIFIYYREPFEARTGQTRRELALSLEELEAKKWIRREGRIVWIRNALRFDPKVNLENKIHRATVLKLLDGLPQQPIVDEFKIYYGLLDQGLVPKKTPGGAGGFPQPVEKIVEKGEITQPQKSDMRDTTLMPATRNEGDHPHAFRSRISKQETGSGSGARSGSGGFSTDPPQEEADRILRNIEKRAREEAEYPKTDPGLLAIEEEENR